MPFTVTMPKLSPTMEEGSIARWTKNVGEFVEAGETLLEINTDKATVEHAALDEGWLKDILVSEGKSVRVNQPIAVFTEEKDESIEGYSPEGTEEAAVETKVAPKKKEAQSVEEIVPTPTMSAPSHVPEPPLEKMPKKGKKGSRVKASPLAKKLADEKGLDLTTVEGSGPGGRVTSQDLDRAHPRGIVTFGKRLSPTDPAGSYTEIELTPMRKVIGKRLQESKSFIPHFYADQEVNASPMIELRAQLKELGLKVTFNDMILRACALALREHPQVNQGYNSMNETLIQFKTVDIAVAVTIDGGLITPIVRHADCKDLGELSLEVKELVVRAKEMKLEEHEYKGGSFTISNLGMYGITSFTAVINPPQAAILAVGGIVDKPVVEKGHVIAGKVLELRLSCDHRVIDGAEAAQFVRAVKHLLENPVSLTV